MDSVEIDTWLAMDNNVVVMHDPRLDRTTNGKGRLLWKTLKEIKRYKTKERGQQVPVLEEVFPLIKRGITLNIEVKNMWTARPVADRIKKHHMQGKVIISSCSVNALRIIRQELPSVRTAYLFYTSTHEEIGILITALARTYFRIAQSIIIKNAQSVGASYVNLSYPLTTKKFVQRLHKKGFKVNVWAVNTPALMRKMIRRGVDGIITNRPDKLKKALSRVPRSGRRRLSLKNLNHKIRLPRIRLRQASKSLLSQKNKVFLRRKKSR